MFGERDVIRGAYLPSTSLGSTWNITLGSTTVERMEPYHPNTPCECKHSLMLPSMVHPHIHLDKAFLLSSNNERYQDLAPESGTFPEALKNTAAAKARFTPEDLFQRGSWLLDESVAAGVTAMRAFVEVDETVKMMCVETAIRLKKAFAGKCFVQICAFAQDPVFSGPHASTNHSLLEEAAKLPEVEALGTTPYVEDSVANSKRNVTWAVDLALRGGLHLDFHLDYNLDEKQEPMIWTVVKELTEVAWPSKTSKTIVVGHCTRLTLFTNEDMALLAQKIHQASLPLSFVGLPSSDIYMMGRPAEDSSNHGQRPRGTLQIPTLIKDYDLNGAIGINNVGNAFTPYGSLDPLWLACLGVGMYHAGTAADGELLYECISTRARKAIGLPTRFLEVNEGDPIDFITVECQPRVRYSQGPPRLQTSVHEMVWDPPSIERRQTYFKP